MQQILSEKESIQLYQNDENFRTFFEDVYLATTPSLFSSLSKKHNLLAMTIGKNQHIYELLDDGTLLYMVGLNHDLSNDVLTISSIYVSNRYRKQGVATRIINHFQENIARDNIILLSAVMPENKAAISLFRKMGFSTPIGLSEVDSLGISYIDFFWSKMAFSVQRNGFNNIITRPK
jgi:ribosomal protein S18 acetylase RimI-like enzyme